MVKLFITIIKNELIQLSLTQIKKESHKKKVYRVGSIGTRILSLNVESIQYLPPNSKYGLGNKLVMDK